jgi:hypothetical protein
MKKFIVNLLADPSRRWEHVIKDKFYNSSVEEISREFKKSGINQAQGCSVWIKIVIHICSTVHTVIF